MMNKKGNTALMITMFIVLLIGLITFQIINPLIVNKIQTSTVTEDTFTASNTTCTAVTTNGLCIQSVVSSQNASNGVDINPGNWSICTSAISRDGLLLDGDATTNARFDGENVNATYTQRDCQPITGTTATIIGYVPLLFAVILLVFVATLIK